MDSTSGNWRPLAAAYADGVTCPPRQAAVVTAALLADLARLHRAGKVHGAIDPGHVLVAEGGRARLAEGAGDGAAAAYQAPELYAGQPVSASSDLFAAGLVFYRLLTGMNPFDGSAALVRQRVTNMMPPRPSEITAEVPRGFDPVVEKAIAKRPGDRYASAEAFAEALMQALVPSAASAAGADDTTLATTVVRRRPSPADETIMRGPAPDATVMRGPDPNATVLRAPNPDATMVRAPSPDATVLRALHSDATVLRAPAQDATVLRSPVATARSAPPPSSPAARPAVGGGKGVLVGAVLTVVLAVAAGAAFFLT